jgi:hypothetical protein
MLALNNGLKMNAALAGHSKDKESVSNRELKFTSLHRA